MSLSVQSTNRTLSDRFWSLGERLKYRLALDEGERREIFRLRHDAYLREGGISARSDRLFRDEADEADNTHLFGIYIDDALVSSIRLSIATRESPDIPSGHVFPDVLGPEIARGRVVVDPTRFCVDHTKSRLHPELPYITLRVAWLAMEHFGADILLAAVRPEHASFYRRFWNTRAATEARDYPLLAKPIVLTLSDYAQSRELVEGRYPLLASTEAERREVFGRVGAHEKDVFRLKSARDRGHYALV